MSATPSYATAAEAVAAFRAGGKRWVHVDGHLVDLLTYVEPRRVEVMREDPEPERCEVLPELAVPGHRPCAECGDPTCRRDRYLTLSDRGVEYRATRCEEAAIVTFVRSLPSAVPGVECCRACGRPMIGGTGP